ncbi:MAG TPA: DNA-deoxyinosine glycosylase, partial [Pseudomonadales bacterium]|nr:DNA-deoxyinosine glycosylase [Pseudomonadales bacterium]
MATRVRSFPPIGRTSARTLILGTMPGVASLAAGQYYGHPRNAFWRIVGELFGFDPAASYATRVRRLADSGVAVWDVLASCERAGSLDSRIDPESVVPNDFADFFAAHRRIERICFNGT